MTPFVDTLRRAMALVLVLAAAVLAAGLTTPSGARAAVTYGISDAPGAFAHCVDRAMPCCTDPASVCLPGTVAGYYDDPAFRTLTTPASAHPITTVRLFVDYDAVQEYNGSPTDPGCRFSRVLHQSWTDAAGRVHPPGESLNDLVASLIEAGQDRLSPVVSIAGYESPHAVPPWDAPAPDPTTPAGYWEYRCGVQGILDVISRLPVGDRPHVWEAFNEPDGFPVYNGAGRSGPGACAVAAAGAAPVDGAAKAACLYAIAAGEIHGFAGHAGDTVIAGVLSQPSVPYLRAYAAMLGAALPGPGLPAVWSVHDYADVTRSFAAPQLGPLQAFDAALASASGGAARDLWVTEAGTELTDPEAFAGCGAVAGLPETLGACVAGQAARQAMAAQAFLALPQAGIAVPITHLFWYQWQGEPDWDSAITDGYGQPRAPWCVLFGTGTCMGNPNPA